MIRKNIFPNKFIPVLTKNFYLLFYGIVIVFLFSGCTLEKRRYQSGYHIEWNHMRPTNTVSRYIPQVKPISIRQVFSKDESLDNRQLKRTFLKSYADIKNLKRQKNLTAAHPVDCDVITLRNGDEIKATVQQVSSDEIKYKLCNDTTGFTYAVKAADVFMIAYPNGTKDLIQHESKQPVEKKDSGVFGVLSFMILLLDFVLAPQIAYLFLILLALAIVLAIVGLGKGRRLKFFALLTLTAALLFLILLLVFLSEFNGI
jgi:hypothetical protein